MWKWGVGCWTMPNHDRWVWNWWKSWSIVSTPRSAAWCFHLWEFGKVCWKATSEAVVVITINRTFNAFAPTSTGVHFPISHCNSCNISLLQKCSYRRQSPPKGAMLHICKNKSSGIWFSITCKWPFPRTTWPPLKQHQQHREEVHLSAILCATFRNHGSLLYFDVHLANFLPSAERKTERCHYCPGFPDPARAGVQSWDGFFLHSYL